MLLPMNYILKLEYYIAGKNLLKTQIDIILSLPFDLEMRIN